MDKFITISRKRKVSDDVITVRDKETVKQKTKENIASASISEEPRSSCSTTQESQSLPTAQESQSLPAYLNQLQWQAKFKEHTWLNYKNGGFGCTVCKSASGTLGAFKLERVRLSNEWCTFSVKAFGDTDTKKRQAIRNKIFDHKTSSAHIQCLKIVEQSNKNPIIQATEKQEAAYQETTCRVFRTVYNIAKLGRPFSDLPFWIDTQKANGIDMGLILQSDHVAADISNLIAEEMRKTLVNQIVEKKLKIGVMIDESTTVSHKIALVICLRVIFPGTTDEASSFFFDLVELPNATSNCIYNSLKTVLLKHFEQSFLATNLISFACDGASNMLGSVSGVAAKLQEEFPELVIWHCANHRLELTVGDVVSEMTEINHMKIFFDKLYSLYSASPKNRNQLNDCASNLSTKIQCIGRILGTRWVASSVRSVKAVWNDFPALSLHFQNASNDSSRDSRERAQYKGLHNRLTDVNFVLNMGLMIDALSELQDLSLQLQKRDISLIHAHKLVQQKIQVFHSLQTRSGEFFELAENSAHTMTFKGVELHGPGRVILIGKKDFYGHLMTKMERRLLTTQSTRAFSSAASSNASSFYKELLLNLDIFDRATWPQDIHSDICFGDKKIRFLSRKFGINDREAVTGFREYSGCSCDNSYIPNGLKPLSEAIKTIIISTAECERAFSGMNIVLTPSRNQLQVSTVSSLLFLKLIGPPIEQFKPEKYVKLWLGRGRRSADDNRSMKRKPQNAAPPGMKPIWDVL